MSIEQHVQADPSQSPMVGSEASLPDSGADAATEQEQFRADYAESVRVIFKESSQHEIYYKTLCLVQDESNEETLCQSILALPEMKLHLRPPRFYLDVLHSCGSLRRVPVSDGDADAQPDASADIDGVASDLPSDAVDSAASETPQTEQPADPSDEDVDEAGMPQHFEWFLTAVGSRLIDDLSPVIRLDNLLNEQKDVEPIYLELLDYCKTPRKRTEIETYLDDRQTMERLGVAASYFLDCLEQNGGLIWEGGWKTTPDGEVCLKQRSK